jgi:hypothetical protein
MSVPKVSKVQARVNATAEEREVLDALRKNPPPNKLWDEVRNLYEISVGGLQKTHGELVTHIDAMLSDPVRRAKIQDMDGLLVNIQILTKDVQTHLAALNELYARHKDKTGGTTAPEEYLEVIGLHGQYSDAIQVYNTVIMPTVSHIFEQIRLTEEIVEDQIRVLTEAVEQDLKNLADPNVISDVEVK